MTNALEHDHDAVASDAIAGFSGSYASEDVAFLLAPMDVGTVVDVAEKEALIQTGARHYSEMISLEKAPDPVYLEIFEAAMQTGARRMARETIMLAKAMAAQSGPITLASLVRAGVPLGVLLKRTIRRMGRDVEHYDISIIRDRGLDAAAMEHVLARRPGEGLFFVDGWTGKGAIATELERSAVEHGIAAPRLVVLADPVGRAWLAASGDDWLIPSGILGSTVSGLISRSILDDSIVAMGGFHGCRIWDHLAEHDISRQFVDRIWEQIVGMLDSGIGVPRAVWDDQRRRTQRIAAETAVAAIASRHGVDNLNRIKPGIAEATRAILRRAPERVFVRSRTDADLKALVFLAERENVSIEARDDLGPYRAVTLIRKTS